MVLQQVRHIVVTKEQMGAVVQLDIMVKEQVQAEVKLGEPAMVLELEHQQAVDDGIYKLNQTCTVQFSHNRNTLSHPVIIYKNSSLEKTCVMSSHHQKKMSTTFTKDT